MRFLLFLPLILFASVQEEYDSLIVSYKEKDWDGIIRHADNILRKFASSPFIADAYYFNGVAFFEKNDLESADYYFSSFLDKGSSPKHFESSVLYKFKIANRFASGEKKHLMGIRILPKLLSAREDALHLYNQVISMLPYHNICAESMFKKANILAEDGDYLSAVDEYQALIERFPNHYLVLDSYVAKIKMYKEEALSSFLDPYFLEMINLSLQELVENHPNNHRLDECFAIKSFVEDMYAADLWESVLYFDKKNKKDAAKLYYNALKTKYPNTKYSFYRYGSQ